MELVLDRRDPMFSWRNAARAIVLAKKIDERGGFFSCE
jgi:hypothetical protein